MMKIPRLFNEHSGASKLFSALSIFRMQMGTLSLQLAFGKKGEIIWGTLRGYSPQ